MVGCTTRHFEEALPVGCYFKIPPNRCHYFQSGAYLQPVMFGLGLDVVDPDQLWRVAGMEVGVTHCLPSVRYELVTASGEKGIERSFTLNFSRGGLELILEIAKHNDL